MKKDNKTFIEIIFVLLSGFQSYTTNNILDEKNLFIDSAVNEVYEKNINKYKDAFRFGADYVSNNEKEFPHVNMNVMLYTREDKIKVFVMPNRILIKKA